jgi:tetratricopeptide (TPR) repeat protein
MLLFGKKRTLKPGTEKFRKTETRVKLFSTLTKAYVLTANEKLFWSGMVNYVQALRLNDSDAAFTAIAIFGVICSVRDKKNIAEKVFDSADFSGKNLSVRSSAFSNFCIALHCLGTDKLKQAKALAEHSKIYYESSREPWELMMSSATIAMLNFLKCNFEIAEQVAKSVKELSQKYRSAMNIGWALGFLPFIKYCQGEINAETASTQIADGVLFSECVQDHAYLAVSYSNLSFISRMSGSYDETLQYAKKILLEVSKSLVKMNIFIIPVEEAVISLVDVLKNVNIDSKEKKDISKLLKKSIKILTKESKNSLLVLAVYKRALSSIFLLNNKINEAKKECEQAINILRDSDYKWELLKTLAFASNNGLLSKEEALKEANQLLNKSSIKIHVLFKNL